MKFGRGSLLRSIRLPSTDDLTRPIEYPAKAPTVTALTTNGGRSRFNPNIYANGKVCLYVIENLRAS